MKHNAKKILALLLTLVMLVGVLPGMTAYAADTYTLTVKYGSKTILTVSNYPIGYELYISGELLGGDFDSFWGDPTPSGIVSDVERTPDSKFIIFCVYHTGNGTLSGSYGTPGGGPGMPYLLTVTCVKNAPVTGVSLDPGSLNLTVGKWSIIEGDHNIGLYSDEGCTTPFTLGTATDTLTAYVKGITVDLTGTVKVESNADSSKSAICTVKVNAAGFTVTYDANGGSGEMEPTKVSKNDEGKYIYKVESCGFTAPEGETFDYWLGSDGKTYRPGPEVEINSNLTLTAQWKDEEKPDGGEKKTGGSGSGFDLVFNIPGEDNSWGYGGGYAPQQAYRVSLAPMQGGSAALGLTTGESTETAMNVYPTTTVYVFPNAEQGYVLDKIVWSLIDGSASYDITEAKNFVMPAMDVVVYVTFKPAA